MSQGDIDIQKMLYRANMKKDSHTAKLRFDEHTKGMIPVTMQYGIHTHFATGIIPLV